MQTHPLAAMQEAVVQTVDELMLNLGIDAHVHFRQGPRALAVVKHTAFQFGQAIVMPNVKLPAPHGGFKHITTVKEVLAYEKEIQAAVPDGYSFDPIMSFSLDPNHMTKKDMADLMSCEKVPGGKLYAGVTTNAEGITDVKSLAWMFEAMQKADKVLMVHGEAGQTVDVFRREQMFYGDGREMDWIASTFPELRISCEHISTAFVVEYMKRARKGIFATVTPHHLLATRNDMLGQGFIDPHYFCMPIPKEEDDRLTLLHYVFSELANVGIGTDSAPHAQHGNPKEAKETGCGCAGCFVAHAGLEFYAEAAESVGRLHVLPAVLDRARQFYRLPKLKGQVRLTRQSWQASENYEFGDAKVVPFRQGTPLQWRAERVL